MRGWKTLLLNLGAASSVVLLEILRYLADVDWSAHLPPHAALWMVVGVNVANIVLRHVTFGPPAWREGRR
ncbi:hypothetical protein [Stappia sp. ES.058]|uniref:hypothetical protein n=1 Tax=Stappia sp. ES.058 TaxID=1881061 RepID=UPI00087BA5E4|nr:hypothetical protein [Stappia sp. ES.058]SDT99164.1 hypothetical protein SAMN05428979_0962 [Stappia sp. ES.058]